MDIEQGFCDKVKFFIFETASAFPASCAYKLNNTATPSLDTTTGSVFQVVQRGQSLINSMSSLLFCAIVAVVEVEVGRRMLLLIDFREFQGCELQNGGSLAKMLVRRRDSEVGMVIEYHLGDHLGRALLSSVWLGKWHSRQEFSCAAKPLPLTRLFVISLGDETTPTINLVFKMKKRIN